MSHKVIKSTVIYISAEIVNKAVPFLLLPFLTAFLSPNDFGVIATYQAILQVLLVIISLSMQSAISVLFFKVDTSFFKKILTSIFLSSIILAIAITLIISVFYESVLSFVGVDAFWALILPVIVLFQAFSNFFLVYYQVRKMQKEYVIFQLLNTIVNASLSILLICYWDIGLEGRIAGIGIASFIFGLWALFNLTRNEQFDFSVSRRSFVVPIRFSLPLVPHSLSSWIKTSIDRLFLMYFLGASVVGEYSVMYQFSMILSVVYMAANKAILPFLYEKMKSPNLDKKLLIKGCVIVCCLILFSSSVFLIVLPALFDFFIDGRYQFYPLIAYFLVAGFMFQGFYFILINFLMYYEKTKVASKVAIVNSIVHLILSLPLIYYYGAFGAAITNCISWFLLLALTLYYGNKVLVFPWNRGDS